MNIKDKKVLVVGSGISGIAVVSALFARPDIRLAAEELKAAVRRDILHQKE